MSSNNESEASEVTSIWHDLSIQEKDLLMFLDFEPPCDDHCGQIYPFVTTRNLSIVRRYTPNTIEHAARIAMHFAGVLEADQAQRWRQGSSGWHDD